MLKIPNPHYQDRSLFEIEPNVRLLTENNLCITGPGVYSYPKGSKMNLYIVTGSKNIPDPVRKLKSLLHVGSLNQRAGLYTDFDGAYFLCLAGVGHNIAIHPDDVFISSNGVGSAEKLQNQVLDYPEYSNWEPLMVDTMTVPFYTYFLNQNDIELDTHTMNFIINGLLRLSHNDLDSRVPQSNEEFENFSAFYRTCQDFI